MHTVRRSGWGSRGPPATGCWTSTACWPAMKRSRPVEPRIIVPFATKEILQRHGRQRKYRNPHCGNAAKGSERQRNEQLLRTHPPGDLELRGALPEGFGHPPAGA